MSESIRTSIVWENFQRLSQESSRTDSFEAYHRQIAEDKIYYLRDSLSPDAFEMAVDQEILLSIRKAASSYSQKHRFEPSSPNPHDRSARPAKAAFKSKDMPYKYRKVTFDFPETLGEPGPLKPAFQKAREIAEREASTHRKRALRHPVANFSSLRPAPIEPAWNNKPRYESRHTVGFDIQSHEESRPFNPAAVKARKRMAESEAHTHRANAPRREIPKFSSLQPAPGKSAFRTKSKSEVNTAKTVAFDLPATSEEAKTSNPDFSNLKAQVSASEAQTLKAARLREYLKSLQEHTLAGIGHGVKVVDFAYGSSVAIKLQSQGKRAFSFRLWGKKALKKFGQTMINGIEGDRQKTAWAMPNASQMANSEAHGRVF